MKGRSSFTRTEIAELRALIREKQTADRDRQKVLRGKMRLIGFYITDFSDYSGFTVSDFDRLISRGAITVLEEEVAEPSRQYPGSKSEIAGTESRPGKAHTRGETSVDGLALVVSAVEETLRRPEAVQSATIPPSAGLYAIYGNKNAGWNSD